MAAAYDAIARDYQRIIARAAEQLVDAAATRENVVAIAAMEDVVKVVTV